MEINLKNGVYNKIINALNSLHNISDIKKDTTKNFEFSCLICSGINMSFELRKKVDLLVLKSEAIVDDADEETIFELGSEITEESNIRFTSYENTIVFQLVLPLVEAEGVEGQKAIFNETLSFVHLMCKYKDRLGCNHISASGEDLDFTKEAEDDPYGFNSFSDEESEMTTKTNQEEDIPSDLDIFMGEDTNFGTQIPLVDADINDDVTPSVDIDSHISTENISLDLDKDTPEDDAFSLDTNKNTPDDVPEEDIFTDNSFVEPEVPNIPEQSEQDELEERLKKLEEKKQKRKEKRNSKKHDTPPKEVHQEDVEPVMESDTVLTDDVQNNEKGEVIDMVQYERAPEVVEQMKHLYAEVDQIFAKKKEQADYREKTLDEFSARLDRKEEELRVRTERLEANFQEKQAELEKKELAFQTQAHEIDFQWEKLRMEQDMVNSQKKDLEESQAVFEKMKNMEQASSSQSVIDELNATIEKKEQELVTLRANMDADKSAFEETKTRLEDKIATLQTNGSSEELERLQAELADAKDEIQDVTDESEEKDKIIEILQTKQTADKNTIANLQRENSNCKKKIRELEEKAKEVVPVTVKNSDELDAALMKIKMLESKLESTQKMLDTRKDDISVAPVDVEHSPEYIRLKQELDKANSDLQKADEAYEREKKAKENALKNSGASSSSEVDSNKVAVKIKEDLAQIGVEVAPVASASELILSGSKDDVSIVVNVEAGMLYMEKTVKRAIKYKQTFDKWNIEDIRVSYLFNDKSRTIICKYSYNDVSAAVMETLEKFKPLD